MSVADPVSSGISSALGAGRRFRASAGVADAQARYLGTNTSAQVTPEDQAFAETLRSRAGQRFGAATTDAVDNINRRFAARGGGRSPAQEAAIGSAQQRLGAQMESNEGGIQSQMYNVLRGREAFNRQRAHDIFSSDVSDAMQQQQLAASQKAGFWNSIGGALGVAASIWGGAPAKVAKIVSGGG